MIQGSQKLSLQVQQVTQVLQVPGTSGTITPNVIFSLKTMGVIYFWKAGDTRISEIKFAGTTGPTGTSGTRYIRYPRYLKTPNAWFYDKPDVNEITDLTESGKLNQVPGICD